MRWDKGVFLFFILFCVDLFAGALKADDEGVCVVNSSERKTRMKSFTKRCGKRKCVAKKIEPFTVPKRQLVCCKGWGYDAGADACTPICSTGCQGGRCTAPDVCTCPPPAHLHPEHSNICVQPVCNPPCSNATCTADDTCECQPNHGRVNATHCEECDEGYILQGDVCEPICEPNCVNGTCIAPQTCRCNQGYENKDELNCVPSCVCVNGTCVAPDVCECNDGYLKVNDTTCAPKCEGCIGECVGPNLCRCPDGYVENDGDCEPVCDGACENGYCLEPNVCTCHEGYKRGGTDTHNVCERDCKLPLP